MQNKNYCDGKYVSKEVFVNDFFFLRGGGGDRLHLYIFLSRAVIVTRDTNTV